MPAKAAKKTAGGSSKRQAIPEPKSPKPPSAKKNGAPYGNQRALGNRGGTGRPTKYKDTFAKQVARACEVGFTDHEIAELVGVDERTIHRWKNDHPEFLSGIKAAKDEADERVVRSLYHRAVGYKHEAVKIFMPANAEAPVYAPYVEHVPPDTGAAIFWLKNRRSQEWRDTRFLAGDPDNPLVTPEAQAAHVQAIRTLVERLEALAGSRGAVSMIDVTPKKVTNGHGGNGAG